MKKEQLETIHPKSHQNDKIVIAKHFSSLLVLQKQKVCKPNPSNHKIYALESIDSEWAWFACEYIVKILT